MLAALQILGSVERLEVNVFQRLLGELFERLARLAFDLRLPFGVTHAG